MNAVVGGYPHGVGVGDYGGEYFGGLVSYVYVAYVIFPHPERLFIGGHVAYHEVKLVSFFLVILSEVWCERVHVE